MNELIIIIGLCLFAVIYLTCICSALIVWLKNYRHPGFMRPLTHEQIDYMQLRQEFTNMIRTRDRLDYEGKLPCCVSTERLTDEFFPKSHTPISKDYYHYLETLMVEHEKNKKE